MDECSYFLLTSRQRKRKRAFFQQSLLEGAIQENIEDNDDQEAFVNVARLVGVLGDKPRKPRGPDRDRNLRKQQWDELYRQKSDDEFVEKMRITRATFNNLLNILWDELVLTPTNLKPEPTTPDRQLALTLYRLAHGVTYTVLEDVFGTSKESGCMFFNKVIRLIVAYIYDEYVKLPETDDEWEAEVRGFIENYGFPALGAWDGFHVHVESQLKANFSLKKKYTVNNLALTSYNKRFLYAAIGAPGSTHDARMLKESSFFDGVLQRKSSASISDTSSFCMHSKTSLLDDFFSANLSSVAAKQLSGSARTSAYVFSSVFVQRLSFFASLLLLLFFGPMAL